MKRGAGMWIAFVICLLLGWGVAPAQAQILLDASVGYDRTVFAGAWVPFQATINNDTDQVQQGMLYLDVMRNESEFDTYAYPVTMQAGEELRVQFPIYMGVLQRSFDVSLVVNGECVAQTETAVGRFLEKRVYPIAILGGDQRLVDSFCSAGNQDVLNRQEELVAVEISTCFPELSSRELQTFGALVIGEGAELDDAALEKLDAWIRDGGVLILGPESGAASSWSAAHTGVRFGPKTESTDWVSALMDGLGAAAQEQSGESTIYPLSSQAEIWIRDGQQRGVLARSAYDDGWIVSCGFSLTDAAILESAKRDAFWQRVLIATDADLYKNGFGAYSGQVSKYSADFLLSLMKLDEGVSVFPVLITLGAYVLLAGVGFYVMLRRADHGKRMWVYLPVAAVVGGLAVYGWSGVLALNAPAAASVRVIHYDEEGRVYNEEQAYVGYPDQSRVTITAQNATSIERTESLWYDSAEPEETVTLRDIRILGSQPSIELKAVAPWLAQNLSIRSDEGLPEGEVTARAWMEEDGLHATIQNGTSVNLENAVLLTSLGYVTVGDIPVGETREAALIRPAEIVLLDGEQAIFDGELLRFSRRLFQVVNACTYPPSRIPSGEVQLSIEEQNERSLKNGKLDLGTLGTNDAFCCVLVADCPDVSGTTLYHNGERITRHTQMSVLTADVRFEPVSPSGHYYYPEGTFKARQVEVSDEGFRLTDTAGEWYQEVNGERLFGFDLSALDPQTIDSIQITNDMYDSDLRAQVFDWKANTWVELSNTTEVSLSIDVGERMLDEAGRIFIRYTSDNSASGVYVPEIAVEGGTKDDSL